MDEYKVKITPQASAQMFEIFIYISGVLKESGAATRLLDELEKRILSLCTMPKRIALVDEEPWKSHGIHKMPVKNFLVYFWVNDELKEVHITAVIYGRRDQREALKQMDI
ncbi:MAG: type II toxin-antitoxin system RelE/ParE family toxin [Ruminococcaceae bacterium]|nr:type II toxin-antitoxin system RelE/ParE family toxin [Oscillospiraceae bacterium]